ncbi:CAP domain [Phytophthora cactorum]|nr:CAP domain [Phytophthora cactorum]
MALVAAAVNFRQDLLDAINAARKKEGMDELCLNEMLMDAAQIQANDMADNNFIKSTGSDGSVPKERAAAQGFKAETVTEIVGAGYRTASSIVAAWSKASSAKSTIFSKSNVMGPGYTFDKTKKYVHFWAVDFSTGECGNGTATGGPAPSGDSSGSVELPSSGSDAPKSSDASGSVEAPESGSGAPAPAGSGAETPAVTPAPAGSGAETPASGSGDPPAATPAPAGSDAETPPVDRVTKNLLLPPLLQVAELKLRPVDRTPASGSGDEPAATPAPAEEEPETSQ